MDAKACSQGSVHRALSDGAAKKVVAISKKLFKQTG